MTGKRARRPAGHSHGHGGDHGDVVVDRLPRLLLLAGLALAFAATLIGLVVLWPSAEDRPADVNFLEDGVTTQQARVSEVGEPCPVTTDQQPAEAPPQGCNQMTVTLLDGPEKDAEQTLQVPPYVVRAGLTGDDTVTLIRIPGPDGAAPSYGWLHVDRSAPIGWMLLALVVVVAAVARLRGILALVGLALAGVVISTFMLPALLSGESGLGVALVGSSLIMFVVLYLAHGPSLRTSTALAGTLVGVGVTALIGLWAVSAARLSGLSDDTGEQLMLFASDLNFRGLLTCAVIIAGLGVLNDVTITQASSVWELRAASPSMSRPALFAAGMRIGRDHIASTIYTIVFAYAGTALAAVLLLSLYDRPMLELISDEALAEEVVRTLASAIGLVLAVPVTTGIAVLVVGRQSPVAIAD